MLVPATASAEVLFNNVDETSPQSINSQDFNPANNAFDAMTADDFVVPAGEKWHHHRGARPRQQRRVVPATSANVSIFADAGGTPGAEVFPTRRDRHRLPADEPVVRRARAERGHLLVRCLGDPRPGSEPPFNQWYWAENSAPFGSPAVYRNPGNGFSTGCTSFTVKSTCVFSVGDPVHPSPGQSFNLSGTRTVPPTPPPTGDSAACTAAKEKLDKAKDKLKKAKDKAKGAKGKAKKKAKAKVKKAKDTVKKANAEVSDKC